MQKIAMFIVQFFLQLRAHVLVSTQTLRVKTKPLKFVASDTNFLSEDQTSFMGLNIKYKGECKLCLCHSTRIQCNLSKS